MDSLTAERLRLMRRILDLQGEICQWGSHNSQSNPGAVMELRALRKDLLAAQTAYEKFVTASNHLKPGEQMPSDSRGGRGGGAGTGAV